MCKGFTALQESDKTLICFHHSYHDHESETKGKFSRLVQNRQLIFFNQREVHMLLPIKLFYLGFSRVNYTVS